MQSIALLGLGVMGRGMAANLVKARRIKKAQFRRIR
jgi:3-hydroxyisobutyrate dehydrogenase-like beta-hydroxyacid dehydrogenase